MNKFRGFIISAALALGVSACLLQAAWAAAPPRLVKDPGTVPPDTFVMSDEALRASWPQGNLTRMGKQSPQWKPMSSDPKTYFSDQKFSAYGGSGLLAITVSAGQAMSDQLKNPGSLKENTESLIRANRYQDEKIIYLKDCSAMGYPYLYHYLSASGPGSGMTHQQEGFSGYARGYFIMFFFKASNKQEYMPPPQWLEGRFFKWLEGLPALDGPGAGGVSGASGPGGVSDRQAAAATAAAGAAMAGGLTLQKLLGGGPVPAESGGSAGGSEARGSEEGEDKRGRGYRYWMRATAYRRRLKADGTDSLWVYARVETDDPEGDTAGMTADINFAGGGVCGHWLSLGGVQFTGGYAAVPVSASPPGGDAMPAGEAGATVTAWSAGPGGRVSGALDLVLDLSSGGRIETRTHQDRRSLRPDGRDGIWLYAAVVLEGEPSGADRQKANDSLTFTAVGEGAGLVVLGQPQDTGGWKAVYVQASGSGQGQSGGAGEALPKKVPVAVSGRARDQEIRSVVNFDLLPVPVLESDRDQAEFSTGLEGPLEIRVFVSNPGAGQWEFQAEPGPVCETIAGAELRPEGASSAVIVLTRAQVDPVRGAAGYKRGVVRVTASQEGIELEKELKVLLAVEGIDVVHRTYPDRQFRLPADGSSSVEIDFTVLRLKEGDLVSDVELAKSLTFEDCSGDIRAKNAVMAGELEIAFDRVRQGNTPYGVYTFHMRREVPADGSVLPARIRVLVLGLGEEFSRTFDLGLETTDMSPGSRAWEEELKRTEEFIDRFTPEGYRPNFRRILESRKYTLGVEGLYSLRRQIWNVAQDLILARGKSYEAEAAWQTYYYDVANWVKWLGDQAFSIVTGAVLGPGYALATCVTKDAVVDALGRWNAGESFEDYVNNRVKEVLQGLGEYVVNPDEIKKRFGYVKAYGIYFCWRFMYNLGANNDENKPRSASEAAWQAVKDCTTTAVDSWITGICEREAIAKGWKKGGDAGDPSGGDAAGADGRTKSEPGAPKDAGWGSDPGGPGDFGVRPGGGDSGKRGEWEQKAGERRRDWEQQASDRREKWEQEAGERRDQWNKDASGRRKN